MAIVMNLLEITASNWRKLFLKHNDNNRQQKNSGFLKEETLTQFSPDRQTSITSDILE